MPECDIAYFKDQKQPIFIDKVACQVGKADYIVFRHGIKLDLKLNQNIYIKTADDYGLTGVVTCISTENPCKSELSRSTLRSRIILLKYNKTGYNLELNQHELENYIYKKLLNIGYKSQHISIDINHEQLSSPIIHYEHENSWDWLRRTLRDNCLTFICGCDDGSATLKIVHIRYRPQTQVMFRPFCCRKSNTGERYYAYQDSIQTVPRHVNCYATDSRTEPQTEPMPVSAYKLIVTKNTYRNKLLLAQQQLQTHATRISLSTLRYTRCGNLIEIDNKKLMASGVFIFQSGSRRVMWVNSILATDNLPPPSCAVKEDMIYDGKIADLTRGEYKVFLDQRLKPISALNCQPIANNNNSWAWQHSVKTDVLISSLAEDYNKLVILRCINTNKPNSLNSAELSYNPKTSIKLAGHSNLILIWNTRKSSIKIDEHLNTTLLSSEKAAFKVLCKLNQQQCKQYLSDQKKLHIHNNSMLIKCQHHAQRAKTIHTITKQNHITHKSLFYCAGQHKLYGNNWNHRTKQYIFSAKNIVILGESIAIKSNMIIINCGDCKLKLVSDGSITISSPSIAGAAIFLGKINKSPAPSATTRANTQPTKPQQQQHITTPWYKTLAIANLKWGQPQAEVNQSIALSFNFTRNPNINEYEIIIYYIANSTKKIIARIPKITNNWQARQRHVFQLDSKTTIDSDNIYFSVQCCGQTAITSSPPLALTCCFKFEINWLNERKQKIRPIIVETNREVGRFFYFHESDEHCQINNITPGPITIKIKHDNKYLCLSAEKDALPSHILKLQIKIENKTHKIYALTPPIVINLRDTDCSCKLTNRQIKQIKMQQHLAIFIHGFDVTSGQWGKEISGIHSSKQLFPSTLIADLNGFDCHVFRDYRNIARQFKILRNKPNSNLDPILDPNKNLNGRGAYNWFLNMEHNINHASGFKNYYDSNYDRLINISWPSRPNNILDYNLISDHTKTIAKKIMPLIRQLRHNNIKINIIAHSLGCAVACQLLGLIASKYSATVVDNVILCDAAVPNFIFGNNPQYKNSIWHLPLALKAARKIIVLTSVNDNILGPVPAKKIRLQANKPLWLEKIPAMLINKLHAESLYQLINWLGFNPQQIFESKMQCVIYQHWRQQHDPNEELPPSLDQYATQIPPLKEHSLDKIIFDLEKTINKQHANEHQAPINITTTDNKKQFKQCLQRAYALAYLILKDSDFEPAPALGYSGPDKHDPQTKQAIINEHLIIMQLDTTITWHSAIKCPDTKLKSVYRNLLKYIEL